MVLQELTGSVVAHVGGEKLRFGLGKVDDDQAVQAAAEAFVDVEGDEASVELEVMLQAGSSPAAGSWPGPTAGDRRPNDCCGDTKG